MTIAPLPANGVRFHSWTRSIEPRPPVPLLSGLATNGAVLTMCSWCKHARVAPNDWVEIEEALVRLPVFEQEIVPLISHGICPACSATLRQQVDG